MADGCYVSKYLSASYDGISFECLVATSEHGRRGAEGEFPFGENTGYVDMGRRIRKFTIEGRYANNEHIASMAALIASVETPGPKTLVHPTRGVMTVACSSLKVTDDILDGQGYTKFSMDLVEANEWINGLVTSTSLISLDVTGLLDVLSDVFDIDYLLADVPWFLVESVTDIAAGAFTLLADEITRAVTIATAVSDSRVINAVSELNERANDTAVLRNGDKVLRTLALGCAALSTYTTGADKLAAFRRLVNSTASVAVGTSKAAKAKNAVYSAIRAIGATYMARSVIEDTPDTLVETFDYFDTLGTVFDNEINVAIALGNSALHLALKRVMLTAQTTLLNASYNLPAVVTYNFSGSVHSLVAAYEIFSDAKRYNEIEAKNPTSFPWAIGPQVVSGTL